MKEQPEQSDNLTVKFDDGKWYGSVDQTTWRVILNPSAISKRSQKSVRWKWYSGFEYNPTMNGYKLF